MLEKHLELGCLYGTQDKFRVADDVAREQPSVYLEATSGADFVAIYLDTAKARELFNWLGVWLHTH